MKRRQFVGTFVLAAGIVGSGTSFADLNIVTSSRTVSSAATGGYGAPDSHSTNSNASGVFNQSVSATDNGTMASPAGPLTNNENATGSQNTSVSTTLLQGIGSATANISPGSLLPGYTGDATGSSTYDVTFTVSSPQTLSMNGSFAFSSNYHIGALATLNGTVQLTTSAQAAPLYQLSDTVPFFNGGTYTATDPFSFLQDLTPGQTYDLQISSSADLPVGGHVISAFPDSSTFSFAGQLPEPGSISLLALGSLALLKRRAPSR